MDQSEHVIAGLGDIGMHAVGRDHHDACLLEHRRRGAAGGRIAAVDHQLHAVFADQLVGREDRLIGLGLVVIGDELELLAEHPAGGVDILDRHLGRDLCGFAVGGRRSRVSGAWKPILMSACAGIIVATEHDDAGETQENPGAERRRLEAVFQHGFLR